MKFHIPFTFSRLDKQRKKKLHFKFLIKHKTQSKLQDHLENTNAGLNREQYLNIVFQSFFLNLLFSFVIASSILPLFGIRLFLLISLGISVGFSSFVLFSQLVYPKVFVSRRDRDIEKNLIPALQDILIQLNSGIPLYSILVSVSSSDYGELSIEFKKIVKKINAGMPQVQVLDDLGDKNSSLYFKRTLWQISNGMRAGSDISIIVQQSIRSLSEEQLIQVQKYGNKLNPLIMFYMLTSIILPALAITFLTIISSLINLPETMTILGFISLFIVVIFIQIMFMGMIKSSRPSLM